MKMSLFLFLGVSFVIANALTSAELRKGRHKRLVGSTSTSIEEHPYQVEIVRNRNHYCGGVIISEKALLTAAHCVRGADNADIKIHSGTSARQAGQVHDVVHKVLHELHAVNRHQNSMFDIAIVFINPPFKFDATRQPIGLYDRVLSGDDEPNEMATITGWGCIGYRRPLADVLQVLDLPLVSKSFCDHNYKRFEGINEGQICAGYIGKRNKAVCFGDSGGPLVLRGRLIGLLAHDEGYCGSFDHPAVFTEVAYFIPWINKHVKLVQNRVENITDNQLDALVI